MNIIVIGNIGSGKSTVISSLKAHSFFEAYQFVSYDDIIKDLYASNDEFKAKITALVGTCVKKDVSNIVFANKWLRERVGSLGESFARSIIRERLISYNNCIVEYPMYLESGADTDESLASCIDSVVCVYCSEEEQTQRVLSRDGMPVEKFKAIQAAQLSTEFKRTYCNFEYCTGSSSFTTVEQFVSYIKYRTLENEALHVISPQDYAAIKHAYSEPHRAYHNLDHLCQLIQGAQAYKEHKYYKELVLAILYHDFVYSVTLDEYENNELRSAKAFLATEGSTRASVDKQLVVQMILATKEHKVPPYITNAVQKHLLEIFLDLDNSILGQSREVYTQYSKNIQREWSHLGAVYAQQRAKFLKSVLGSRLFQSPDFYALNKIANDNITAELVALAVS